MRAGHRCVSSAGGCTGPCSRPGPTSRPCSCMLEMPHPKFSFLGIFFLQFQPRFSSKNLSQEPPGTAQGTMAAKFGLPDDEIDRLLSEAEARLSSNGSADALIAVSPAQPQPPAKTPAIVAAPTAPTAGGQTAVPETKSEKLSVRVPQLVQKKKVRALLLFSPLPFPLVDDESKSQSI